MAGARICRPRRGAWCRLTPHHRAQDALPSALGGEQYDAVMFDTFAEGADELFRFHALLPRILAPGGGYSFFNGARAHAIGMRRRKTRQEPTHVPPARAGIAAHDRFLHAVYNAAISRNLDDLGLDATYAEVRVGALDEAVWAGTSLRHWRGESDAPYDLPIATMRAPPPPPPARSPERARAECPAAASAAAAPRPTAEGAQSAPLAAASRLAVGMGEAVSSPTSGSATGGENKRMCPFSFAAGSPFEAAPPAFGAR